MAKKRRGKKYKFKMSAGSKRTVIAILIWALAALFAVVCALAIGNALGDIADSIEIEDAAPPLYEYGGEVVPAVDALFIDPRAKNNESLEKIADKLDGEADVSLLLRDSSETLGYKSDVAYSVTGSSGGVCDLSALVSRLKEGGRYVSGCFYSSLASAKGSAAKNAVCDYEAALIAEAFFAGVDDVVVLGLPTDSDGAAYASRLFARVREKYEGARLGAVIGALELRSGDGAGALVSYYKFADFCAIDARSASVSEDMLYYFEEYPLRVLIGENSSAERAARRAALAKLGIYNIQSVDRQEAAG